MYPDTANVEAPVNRYFINDEPGLVREMGAKFRISGHTHMPHEAVVGKTTSIWKPRWVPQRSAGSGIRPGPDHRGRGRLYVCDHTSDCEPLCRAVSEEEVLAAMDTDALRAAQDECRRNGLGSVWLTVYPALEDGAKYRVVSMLGTQQR